MHLLINTDGGSRGNPGPGAIGIIIKNQEDSLLLEIGKTIGVCTNNEAEYTALIEALEKAKELGAKTIEFKLDSELVVKQLKGEYKVKNDRILVLWTKAKTLEKSFVKVTYLHIPRNQNKEADKMVNNALDGLI